MKIENLPRFVLIKISKQQSLTVYLYTSESEALYEVCNTLARMPDDLGEIGVILYDADEDKILQDKKRSGYTLDYTNPMDYVTIVQNCLKTLPTFRLHSPIFIRSEDIDKYAPTDTTNFDTLNYFISYEATINIHCDTIEKAKKLLKYLHKLNFQWYDGEHLDKRTYWVIHEEDTCYQIDCKAKTVRWYRRQYLKSENKVIINFDRICGSSSDTSSEQARNLQTTNFRILNRKLMQGCVSKEDVIVRVRSQEHADTLLRYLKEGGFTWENSDDLLSHDEYFTECDNDICYFINSNKRLVTYGNTKYLTPNPEIVNYEDICWKTTEQADLPDLTGSRAIICVTKNQVELVLDLYKTHNYTIWCQGNAYEAEDCYFVFIDKSAKIATASNKNDWPDTDLVTYTEWLENAYNYIKTRRIIND